MDDLNTKIAKLEARVLELRRDLDEERQLVEEMREYVEDAQQTLDAVREGFDMVQVSPTEWTLGPWLEEAAGWQRKYYELARSWNKAVSQYNAVMNPRPPGRQLAASEAQQRQVERLHRAGTSLRVIAAQLSLSVTTVRTIICKLTGTDRTTAKRRAALGRLSLDPAAIISERRRQRTRDAIPKRIAELDKASKDLRRRAGVSAKR
jgi:DNA-binding NarL/FixJ family response regulator